jgi:PPOX class probable F420-dependent enzyme
MAAELSEDALALLRGPHFATVSTIRRDGSIQGVVTWVDVAEDGTHVLLNTAEGRAWWRNIQRDPRITVVVTAGGHREFLAITGRVVEQTREGADAHIEKLERVYTGHTRYRGKDLAPDEVRTIIVIEPDRVSHYGG